MNSEALFLKNIISELDFLKETYYSMKHQQIIDLQLFATRLKEKNPDSLNAKEHYQSFIRKKKNTNSVKQPEVITQQSNIFENRNIVYTKLVIIKHPKSLQKLSKP